MLNFFREMSNFFESNLRFSGKFTIFQVEMVLFSVNIADFWLNSLFSGHMLTSFALKTGVSLTSFASLRFR